MTLAAAWEATMQAEDPEEPPENGGAVQRSFSLDPDSQYFSVKEVASRTGTSRNSIRRSIEDGQLPAYRFRRSLRIKACDFEAWTQRSRYQPRTQNHALVFSAAPMADYRW